jgi:hypothetical protein
MALFSMNSFTSASVIDENWFEFRHKHSSWPLQFFSSFIVSRFRRSLIQQLHLLTAWEN